MGRRRRIRCSRTKLLEGRCGAAVTAVALAAVVAGCGSSGGEGARASARVESTIADGSRLSEPVVWSATPKGLARNDFVTFVVFRVDGQERWADDAAPYVFQGREWHPGAEFLYPETLGRGAHRLTVEATTARGRRIARSVDVRVEAVATTPAQLAGTWRRRVRTSDLGAAGIAGGIHQPGAGGGDVTAGTWDLRFARNDIVHAVGVESRHYSGTVFHAARPGRLVLLGPANDARFGERHRFCETPRAGRYRWAVRGDRLTLEAIADPACPGRNAVMSGVWRRR
jgi:hypothetical protein